MNRSVAIIPARGGSKRIHQKNIRPFLGIPIIKYSIDSALLSTCFTEVMVSTDDPIVAELARSYGAEVPFLRSEAASDDQATLADVIAEVMENYEKNDRWFDYFCCLLPTAPFVTGQRLCEGFELLKKMRADAVVPVVRFSYPIQRALKVEDGRIEMIWPENRNTRSQDLETAYHDSGQFYWVKTASFQKQRQLIAERTSPMVIPEWEVQDIDTEDDWVMAEIKYQILQSRLGVRGFRGAKQT